MFRDRLTWLRETLLEIKKNKNLNWLVKSHPNDDINKVITSTNSEFEKICVDCNHIKLFPKNIRISSIPKFIDLIITQAGTAGSEYPCLGIPVIVTSQSKFTGRGFTIEPETKEKYLFQLQNIKKLEKLSNRQIENAKVFIFITYKLMLVPTNLIANYPTTSHVDEKKYFTEMTKLIEQYNEQEDILKKMMKIQEKNNDRHAIDYRIIFNKLN